MSFLFAILLVSAQTAVAQQPVADTSAPAPKVKEKKICKSDPEASGTRMTKRLCLTEEEWAQRAKGMMESARAGVSGHAEDH